MGSAHLRIGAVMKFTGSPEFDQFWSLLKDESPRGLAIVVAAYFDEKLGTLLAQTQPQSFYSRINDAICCGLLTQNEHDDLHVIRDLRNTFAHDLRANDFDPARTRQVESLKTWQIASAAYPKYCDFFPTIPGAIGFVRFWDLWYEVPRTWPRRLRLWGDKGWSRFNSRKNPGKLWSANDLSIQTRGSSEKWRCCGWSAKD